MKTLSFSSSTNNPLYKKFGSEVSFIQLTAVLLPSSPPPPTNVLLGLTFPYSFCFLSITLSWVLLLCVVSYQWSCLPCPYILGSKHGDHHSLNSPISSSSRTLYLTSRPFHNPGHFHSIIFHVLQTHREQIKPWLLLKFLLHSVHFD